MFLRCNCVIINKVFKYYFRVINNKFKKANKTKTEARTQHYIVGMLLTIQLYAGYRIHKMAIIRLKLFMVFRFD